MTGIVPIRQSPAAELHVLVCGNRPRGHLTEIKNSVDYLVEKTALPFGQFGQQQIGKRVRIVEVFDLHDFAVSGALECQIICCADYPPLKVQTPFSARDQLRLVFPGHGIPSRTVGIGGIRNPRTIAHDGCSYTGCGRSLLQQVAFGTRGRGVECASGYDSPKISQAPGMQ